MNDYTQFYQRQVDSGIGSLYQPTQKGRGLGSFFGSIFRSVYPYIKSGFSALTNELLNGGIGLLSDTINQVPVKESIANRVKTFGNNLTDRAVKKMTGAGRNKRKRSSCSAQLSKRRRTRKTSTKTRKPKKKVKRLKKKRATKKKSKAKRATKRKSVKKKKFTDIFS
jgi:hypothetical protein